MKGPEARKKSGGGGERVEEHQEVESSSREEGGLCLKGSSHKNRIGRDLVSTHRKADLVWSRLMPVPVPGHRDGSYQ
jgi:hypothetical protein